MRLPVVVSVIVHIAVLAAAVRLPATQARSRSTIEVDIHERRAPTVPVLVPLTPPPEPPKAQPKLALASRERSVETAPRAVPLQPMETAPPSTTPGPSSPQATVPERKGPVDLTLHGLPSTGEWATPGAPVGPAAPQKKGEWRPRGDAGDPILGKLVDKKEDYHLESLGADGFIYNGPQFSAHISPDGSVSFDDKSIGFNKGTSGGSFDLNDLMMRGKHEDPYRHEKKKFMEATSAQRTELAKKAREAQIGQSLAELPWRCDEIWRDRFRTAKERRKLLFILWKETSGDEDGLGEAGQKARQVIEKYIRRYLPLGSPEAYTDAELTAFNSSKGPHFNPYGGD